MMKQGFAAVTLLCVVLVTACATVNIDLPSVTESSTGHRLPGKIIWRDLLTDDPVASKKFYGELFNWTFESVGVAAGLSSDTTYTLIRHNGRLIGGMIDTVALSNRSDISQWIVSMSVTDIDVAVAAFIAGGGEVKTPPTDLQRRGKMAVVRDAEGALLALLQTRDGDPADHEPEVDGFLWDELWTTDVERATTFYADVAGLKAETVHVDGDPETGKSYRLLKDGEKPRVGIMVNPLEGLGPVWVSYIRVQSPAEITARVAELGGSIIVAAQPRAIGGEVAFIAGPSGAGIALQTWPLDRKYQEKTP